MFKRISS